jgi:hypothetical protein
MKTKAFFTITFWLIVLSPHSQVYQKNYGHMNYLHDVCIDQMQSSSEDLIIAGNFFELNFTDQILDICRIDHNSGNIIWQNYYFDPQGTFTNLRVFDIVTYTDQGGADLIAVTGSVMKSNQNHVFIATLDENGSILNAKYYTLNIPQTFHAQGLNIIYTLNGSSGRGFVVGGFTCMDYDELTNDVHEGLIIYARENDLMPMWTTSVNATNPLSSQFDMVSDVTETVSGYFVTGSLGNLVASNLKQSVLCLGIDFDGNSRWANSYNKGNNSEVGVDAFYDQNSNEIYLLANYASPGFFGVTVLDDANGVIDNVKSWYAFDLSIINWYGFTITESLYNNPGSLFIGGYIKEGQYTDESGNPVQSHTIPFGYEFDKATGNQVTTNFFYNIPYQDPGFNDYFDFWSAQMPLIYYPDMAVCLRDQSGYFMVGYRADLPANNVNAEFIKTDVSLQNECYRTSYAISHNALAVTSIETQAIAGNSDFIDVNLIPATMYYEYNLSCPDLSIDDQKMNDQVDIFPNPAHNRLYCNISAQGPVCYSIYGANGIKTGEGKLDSGKPEIDISTLSAGLYFIKLLINENCIGRKVIIE